MPFDLWIKSTSVPAFFQPERVPVPALENYRMAREFVQFFERASGLARNFALEIVEVDDRGRIMPEGLPAADLNAIADAEAGR